MKGNKKILIVAILLLLISVSFSTYAIYKSNATGSATVGTAKWEVKVNNANIAATNEFTLSDFTWTTNVSKVAGKIAPGDYGTVDIVISNKSEVDIDYTVDVSQISVPESNSKITVAADTGSSLTGSIAYNGQDVTVTLKVQWEAVDSDTQNPIDITTGNSTDNVVIPVTVTAVQKPNPAPVSP